jgi:hypothetical protein
MFNRSVLNAEKTFEFISQLRNNVLNPDMEISLKRNYDQIYDLKIDQGIASNIREWVIFGLQKDICLIATVAYSKF